MRIVINEGEETEVVSYLRKMLLDLESGRIVRVALDLQALIQQLEEGRRDSYIACRFENPDIPLQAVIVAVVDDLDVYGE